MSTTPTHPTALGGATTKETTMSSKTLLFTLGALALAACESPTEPTPANLEAMAVGPWQPPSEPVRLERIAFTSDRDFAPPYGAPAYYKREIYVMNADGSGVVRLTNNNGYDANPDLSRDASKIAFESLRSHDGPYVGIYVMSANGSGVVRLTTGHQPVWSPDGSKIAFIRYDVDGNNIYVMHLNGDRTRLNQIVRLTNTPGNDDDPAWSPDGSRIAFRSWRDGNSEIYVMNATDGRRGDALPARLTTNPAYDFQPAWSPDGTKIAFTSTRDGSANVYHIYRMNATDGSGVVRLTNSGGSNEDPAWSPDGLKIAFTSSRDQYPTEIYAMSAEYGDVGGVDRKTYNTAYDGQPSWSRVPCPLGCF
jgi:Tol biopolymer transport system component